MLFKKVSVDITIKAFKDKKNDSSANDVYKTKSHAYAVCKHLR